MNVLSIGYTRELLINDSATDTEDRMLYYSKLISQYFVIVHSLRKHGLKPKRITQNFEVIPSNGINRIHSFLNILRIGISICRREKIDIIQAQDPFFTGLAGYFLSMYFQIPLNVIIYGPNPYDKFWLSESWVNHILGFISRYILKKANGIQIDGSRTKDSLIKNSVAPAKIYFKPVIPPDIETFYKANGETIREGLLNTKFSKIVLFVGRLERQKNLSLYLEAVRDIIAEGYNHVLFILIGDGKESQKLKLLSEHLGINKNILWIPFILREEIPTYFAACDLFVLPSLYEGFAKVLMEAAMAGKPLVTTDVSGADDVVIDGETGFIVELNNKNQLKEKIITLLKDGNLAYSMGEKAHILMENKFKSELMLKKQVEIWFDIAKKENF